MATKKPVKKSSSISVDFEGVESGGGAGAVPEDNYAFEVDEVTRETSDESGKDYLKWTLKITDGPYKGRKLFHNTSLQPQALFNLRGLLEALGFEVPDGPMDLDISDLIGEKGGVATANEKYEGKDRSRCVEFFTLEQLEERQGVDDTPAVKPTKAASKPTKKAEEEETKPAKKVTKKPAKKEEPEFSEGDEVTFTDDEGNEQTGTITGIDDDTYTVTVGKGKKATEWELEADDLTKVEE